MARRPRLQLPGAVYHVMARGNRKLAIFEDDHDRRRLLSAIERMSVRYAVRCYTFCLMGNHYHLVLETPRGNLSLAMRYVNGVYTQAVNRRHQRTGHVFEGRFRSLVVDSDAYLRDLVRYVVLNPVRAGLAQDASAWPWSSYRATAGLEPPSPALYVDWIDQAFGGSTRAQAQLKFRLFVNDALTKHAVMDVNAAYWGPPEFARALREEACKTTGRRPLPRVVRTLARPPLVELFAPCPPSLTDRDRLIRDAHVKYGYRLAEIAAHLGLHPSTASLAVRRIEAAAGLDADRSTIVT
jgi:putative transposase